MVDMKDAQGNSVGSVTISQAGSWCEVQLNLETLLPGAHAIHIHTTLATASDFNWRAGIFVADGKQHGSENPMGPHAGDMPNFTVNADGTATQYRDRHECDDGTDPHSIFTNGGTALMIHAKADDMKTDPTGNAGDRIACGVISGGN